MENKEKNIESGIKKSRRFWPVLCLVAALLTASIALSGFISNKIAGDETDLRTAYVLEDWNTIVFANTTELDGKALYSWFIFDMDNGGALATRRKFNVRNWIRMSYAPGNTYLVRSLIKDASGDISYDTCAEFSVAKDGTVDMRTLGKSIVEQAESMEECTWEAPEMSPLYPGIDLEFEYSGDADGNFSFMNTTVSPVTILYYWSVINTATGEDIYNEKDYVTFPDMTCTFEKDEKAVYRLTGMIKDNVEFVMEKEFLEIRYDATSREFICIPIP